MQRKTLTTAGLAVVAAVILFIIIVSIKGG